MRKLKLNFVIIALLTFVFGLGRAEAFLVDTGTPVGAGFLDLTGSPAGDGPQDLAIRVPSDESVIINSIEGYFAESTGVAGTLSLILYSGTVTDPLGGEVPDTSSSTLLGSITVPIGAGDDWYGISLPNVELSPGDYWIAFEIRPGDTYDGNMHRGAPDPDDQTTDEAFLREINGIYLDSDDFPESPFYPFDLGLRIDGSVVPEPITMVSLGFGLLGGIATRRKRS